MKPYPFKSARLTKYYLLDVNMKCNPGTGTWQTKIAESTGQSARRIELERKVRRWEGETLAKWEVGMRKAEKKKVRRWEK
jgi:hypothetical protein